MIILPCCCCCLCIAGNSVGRQALVVHIYSKPASSAASRSAAAAWAEAAADAQPKWHQQQRRGSHSWRQQRSVCRAGALHVCCTA
jgi:hypothetical protein